MGYDVRTTVPDAVQFRLLTIRVRAPSWRFAHAAAPEEVNARHKTGHDDRSITEES
jgi:hypothetical protein